MKQKLLALVGVNFQVQRNMFLDGERSKVNKKTLGMVLISIMMIVSMIFYVAIALNIIRLNHGSEVIVLYSILGIELCLIAFMSGYRIINNFYLVSDWREMFVYPVKNGVFLLSKCFIAIYQSALISLIFFVPLITYGILTNAYIYYFLEVLFIQIIIMVIPTIYIALASLTVLWIITLFLKSKRENKSNCFIIIEDILIGLMPYVIIDNISSKSIILISSVVIVVIGGVAFYFVGGNVYLTIMKSDIFVSRDAKKIESDISKYEFKVVTSIKSNLIRDAKIIIRTPVLRANYLYLNVVFNIIFSAIFIVLGSRAGRFGLLDGGIYIGVCTWILSLTSFAAITSFSREGLGLKFFKLFPIESTKYILSKIYLSLFISVFTLIDMSILAFLMANSLSNFLLLELLLVSYIVSTVMISIKEDSNSINLSWVEIKDLFEFSIILKVTKPVNIALILLGIYAVLGNFVFKFASNGFMSCLGLIIILMVNIILSILSYRKIKLNMSIK